MLIPLPANPDDENPGYPCEAQYDSNPLLVSY